MDAPEPRRQGPSSGFTLVELLVVIAIIGILIALLLPAVQAAREAARRLQCSNHLKQLGLAAHSHHEALRRWPAGGWGYVWIGDPDLGTNWQQPGGWIFNLLPYMEEGNLYNLQRGKTGAAKTAAASQMIGTPLAGMNCPSRRGANAYLATTDLPHYRRPNYADSTANVARSDYAANSGHIFTDASSFGSGFPIAGPSSYAAGVSDTARTGWGRIAAVNTGVIFPASTISQADIRDGLSHTYLFGEKYLNADSYENGADPGDNESMYMGDNGDIARWTGDGSSSPDNLEFAPQTDMPGLMNYKNWGSAHSGTFNMVFCDGSVHGIAYDIDLMTHSRLGNRKDGSVIDSSGL